MSYECRNLQPRTEDLKLHSDTMEVGYGDNLETAVKVGTEKIWGSFGQLATEGNGLF